MAHPCFSCGSECYCHGDIDDVIVCHTPANCDGCGCDEMFEDEDLDYGDWPDDEPEDWPGDDVLYAFPDDDPEDSFTPCSHCDGHPACEDFGCAIDHGLAYMLPPDLTW